MRERKIDISIKELLEFGRTNYTEHRSRDLEGHIQHTERKTATITRLDRGL